MSGRTKVTDRFELIRAFGDEAWLVFDHKRSLRGSDAEGAVIASLDRKLTIGEAVRFVCFIESEINRAYAEGLVDGKAVFKRDGAPEEVPA